MALEILIKSVKNTFTRRITQQRSHNHRSNNVPFFSLSTWVGHSKGRRLEAITSVPEANGSFKKNSLFFSLFSKIYKKSKKVHGFRVQKKITEASGTRIQFPWNKKIWSEI